MKITLIKPRIGILDNGESYDRVRMEPLTLSVLAGMTPLDIAVDFFDDRCEEIPYDSPTDLVAITVESFTARRAYDIAAEYRRRGVKVIMGGVHPTLVPDEVGRYADAVYVGDAERQWHDVLRDTQKGRLRPRYASVAAHQVQPYPARYCIFAGKKYLPFSLMQFSRGCPHRCTFCAVSAYFNGRHYCRNSKDVEAELQARPGRIAFFVDDNFSANPEKAKMFLRSIVPLKIKWMCQLSIDVAQNDGLMGLMQESGCLGFVVGFESIDKENLVSMNKLTNIKNFKRYGPQVKKLRSHGFHIWAAFTVGHDNDTIASLEEMLDFAIDNRFAFAAFNTLTPYPGTPLYRRLREEGRLLYDGTWWLHPEYRYNYASFRPKHMTADQLTEMAFSMRKRFNAVGSIAHRILSAGTSANAGAALGLIARYGLFFRSEIRRKQGMRFG
jgi:radical SAM superfamily enzyme YgiQ (UPF0313 family)